MKTNQTELCKVALGTPHQTNFPVDSVSQPKPKKSLQALLSRCGLEKALAVQKANHFGMELRQFLETVAALRDAVGYKKLR